jgi:hypothetical protein
MKILGDQGSQILEELETFIDKMPHQKRRRFFYVLDYVTHYFRGERRVPKLDELGFYEEVEELKNLGFIVETQGYLRGITYTKLEIKGELETSIKNILSQKYYPLFREDDVHNKLREIITKSLSAATKLWHKIIEYQWIESKEVEYTISGYGEYQTDVIHLCEELSKCELGYYIGYYSKSGNYSDEFVFRYNPIDTQTLFLKIVEEEVNKVISSLDPATRWCAYLKYVFPDMDEQFALNNTTNRFLPNEIKQAFAKLPDLKLEKFKEVVETILTKERERLLEVIKNLIKRDPLVAQALSALLMFAEEQERSYQISSWNLGKIKEIFSNVYERKLSYYINILRNFGIILWSNYGDIIIPKMVDEVFNEVMRGGAVEIKMFESELDAEAFIEEIMSKATHNVKIWDPYVSSRTLRIVEKAIEPQKVLVEILSSQPTILENIIALNQKGIKITAKIIYQKKGEKYLSPFHDRYLIIDQKYAWHFGPSIHAAGQKSWESASLFPETFGKVVLDAFIYNFNRKDEEWNQEGYQVKLFDSKSNSATK